MAVLFGEAKLGYWSEPPALKYAVEFLLEGRHSPRGSFISMGKIRPISGNGNQPDKGGEQSPEDPAFDDREDHCYWFS